jgi:hypothetical protein
MTPVWFESIQSIFTKQQTVQSSDDKCNSDREKLKERRLSEAYLASGFLGIISNERKKCLNATRIQREQNIETFPMVGLTENEEKALAPTSYYEYGQGFLIGASFFTLSVGGFRYKTVQDAFRDLARQVKPKRQEYQNLDAALHPSSRSFTPERLPPKHLQSKSQQHQHTHKPTPTQTNPITDDQALLISAITFAAIGLVLMQTSAGLLADMPRFYDNVANIPLQRGRSYLCKSMCPRLIDEYKLAQAEQGYLMDDPETIDLEFVLYLVENCKVRMQHESESMTLPVDLSNNLEPRYANVVLEEERMKQRAKHTFTRFGWLGRH